MKREYIVTLKNREDLKSFYEDMETFGGTQYIPDREVELKDRRAISRNTHYLLTDEESEELRKDERVLFVELTPEERGLKLIRHDSYIVSGDFDKKPESTSDLNWGILHCAGNETQRRKGVFGLDQTEQVTDSVTVFNDGENVDVVIIDEPVAYDHDEFLDPDTGQTRFVQYQWFNELDQYMVDLDTQESDYQNFIDSNNTNITYYNCSELDTWNLYHGTHVAGTVLGKKQGWARKSNLYSIAVIGEEHVGENNVIDTLRLFDYLRAFHLNKLNNSSGKINPTVTNHSWGYSAFVKFTDLSQIESIYHRGVLYENSGSWTESYIESTFGVQILHIEEDGEFFLGVYIPAKVNSVDIDVEDAIKDGVIVVAASGNEYSYGVNSNFEDYDNIISFSVNTENPDLFINDENHSSADFYFNRGSSPGSAEDCINVGNISANVDFNRNPSSNYGPIVDVFAPGTNILSCVPDSQSTDRYGSLTGTSMASPQVAGIISCFCTNKDKSEVNNNSSLNYIQTFGIYDEMSENNFNDNLQGTKNLTIACKDRRLEYSILNFNHTPRKEYGVVYPRRKISKI